ncbi:MAG: hypothetical protein WC908_01090 [Candidatus Paceibacterota bacterium]
MIDNKSKIFFGVFFFLLMISIVVTYYHYIIAKDFAVFTDEEVFNELLLEE